MELGFNVACTARLGTKFSLNEQNKFECVVDQGLAYAPHSACVILLYVK